jgi:hypothetical protein
MDIEILTFCDAATSDQQGKINILGTFDTFNVKKLPARHPVCTLVGRLRLKKSEYGEFSLKIILLDPDQEELAKMEGDKIKVQSDFDYIATNILITFQGLELKKEGVHSASIYFNDEPVVSFPFRVKMIVKEWDSAVAGSFDDTRDSKKPGSADL